MLSATQAVEQARVMHGYHLAERRLLDVIRLYWKGRQALPAIIPSSAPREVKELARRSRVNVIDIVVDTLAQSTFVEGFRAKGASDNAAVWQAWQANKLDAGQIGIHRAAFAYGASYAVVLPGTTAPVIKGVSPRSMTALYGESSAWPMWAFERLDGRLWRLFDEEGVYTVGKSPQKPGDTEVRFDFISAQAHTAPGVTPVVRFIDQVDLDADDDVSAQTWGQATSGDVLNAPMLGQVAPLMKLQDQIDLTTFNLKVAEWYSAFRQRYAIGWVPEDEAQRMKASAAQLWTFDESPDEMQLGEFSQTQLDGYIRSREASIRHAAALSQTPVHELTGEMVNLSAEALAAAEAGKDRKVGERKKTLGESHEQALALAAHYMGEEMPVDSQVVWADTSAKAFAATVDALGKLATMLGVPVEELWERIPGTTQQDVERWRERGATKPAAPAAPPAV